MNKEIERTLGQHITTASNNFPVVLLTGPRQVGKTTLLQSIQEQGRSYLTLDDPVQQQFAKKDPVGFLRQHKTPLLIDEVQYAPELFPYIKMMVDEKKQKGMFWLTGSQQFSLMKNVSESLAGRVAIMDLRGVSLAEERGEGAQAKAFLPGHSHSADKDIPAYTSETLFTKIWRGSFPAMVANPDQDWDRFYKSYIASYLQRDVRDYAQVENIDAFLKFLQVAAARTGQLLNYADMARDVGVSVPAIKAWISILNASGLIYIMQPFFNNHTKRAIKTPKLYFLDTGLCSHLLGWTTPTVLERGAMAGAMFETYIVSEVIKSYFHTGKTPRLYFYRDKDKREIDIILEENGQLYLIEVKKTATPRSEDARHFDSLTHQNYTIGGNAILCLTPKHLWLTRHVEAIPVHWI